MIELLVMQGAMNWIEGSVISAWIIEKRIDLMIGLLDSHAGSHELD
jgi:hypothetical protein